MTLFRVAFVGDPQADNATQVSYARRSVFRELRERKDLDLVVVLGDLVNDEPELIGPMAASLDSLPCPWVAVPGNHDRDVYRGENGRARDVATWRRGIGYVDTAFVRGGVKFILMNDVRTKGAADYEAGFSARQKAWLAAELAATPRSQMTVLATHIPLTEMHARDTLALLLSGAAFPAASAGVSPGSGGIIPGSRAAYAVMSYISSPDSASDMSHGSPDGFSGDIDDGIEGIGRRLLLVSGHTHQVRRETLRLTGRQLLAASQAPRDAEGFDIESLVVGATCGSWWRGVKDAIGIPDALMNCGSPRGYFIADFDRHGYRLTWHTLTCGEALVSPSASASDTTASSAASSSNTSSSSTASSLSDKISSIKKKVFSQYHENGQVSVFATDSTLIVNVFGGHMEGTVRVKGIKLPKHAATSQGTGQVTKKRLLTLSRRHMIAPEVEERIAFNSSMTREYRREHQEEYIPMRRLASPHVWAVDVPDAASLRGRKVTVIYSDSHMSFRTRLTVR